MSSILWLIEGVVRILWVLCGMFMHREAEVKDYTDVLNGCTVHQFNRQSLQAFVESHKKCTRSSVNGSRDSCVINGLLMRYRGLLKTALDCAHL